LAEKRSEYDSQNEIQSGSNEMQRQRMAALETMAGAVAHYFNNILGGAVTTADFALASDDPDMHKRALKVTVDALSRVNWLTSGLLVFAEGKHADTRPAEFSQILDQHLARLEPRLKANDIRVEVRREPVVAAYSAKAIGAVLDCLLSNAVEVMPNGGTLTVTLRNLPESNQFELRIGDTGPGIPVSDLPRIFEPFFTTKQTSRLCSTEHVGLGLAIVHGIIKGLHGTVHITSGNDTNGSKANTNTGTTVVVQLPTAG